jgi:PIN domain nuclease of toxin-antitoxin system
MFLLDTCAYLWYFSAPEELSAEVRDSLDSGDRFAVSLASVWEVAIKVQLGKLRLDVAVEDWVRRSLSNPCLDLLPLTPTVVVLSTQLPGAFHKDPFDRAIVATARRENLVVVTRDERILSYGSVRSTPC